MILRRLLATSATVKRKAGNSVVSLEQEFQRLTPLEHILTCPNMYIGSTTLTDTPTTSKANMRHVVTKLNAKSIEIQRTNAVKFIPALVKIFDEVLVNACDNAIRDPVNTTEIKVEYDGKTFSIQNNGKGIPVVMHLKEQLYIPELVLGHLLTGSNFDKSADKETTGGRHGYGAKLANVFSTRFTCETVDAEAKKKFTMAWCDNMKRIESEAEVSNADGLAPYTKITFTPDWHRFGIKKMDAGSLKMIQTRVVETAGLLGPHVSVRWNGNLIPKVTNFESLCSTMSNNSNKVMLAETKLGNRIAIGKSSTGQFEHTSFVNNMSTWRGGVHVDTVAQQITKYIQSHLVKKATEQEIKRHLELFVDFRAHQPEFDSQSKEKLTASSNLDLLHLSDAALKKLATCTELIQEIESSIAQKAIKRVNTMTKRVMVPKLEDATFAGTGKPCTLILTEGDSAKASAMCGLEVVGRDAFGVYPLRGKLLNVRGLPITTVAQNQEIKNIMSILGIKIGTKYSDDVKTPLGLRYTSVMFMTDGDHDGSHIKGLLLNLFDYFWPELTQREGFLTQFVTPLLKAIPTAKAVASKRAATNTIEFFTSVEYETWKQANMDKLPLYRIKYYKGLGTSSPSEARAYFSNLNKHIIHFTTANAERDRELIDMAFSKSRAADRKQWLLDYQQHVPAVAVANPVTNELQVDQFINQELIHYSLHNNDRSIPHVYDGLKPSQRKVLFALFLKDNSEEEFKVTRLSGFIAEQTCYHHGETSLHSTIIKMAQDFVGANNLPLLVPIGQFGSRATGGEDASAARYLSTSLSRYARLLFPKEDDALLLRKEDDGVEIEPHYYLPIVPLVLINGSQGVGTGWSSTCPQFHPLHICKAVREWIAGAGTKTELKPWYKGFRGTIKITDTGYSTHGAVQVLSTPPTKARSKIKKVQQVCPSVIVTELPIGMWTEDFKQYLKSCIELKTHGILSFAERGSNGGLEIQINFDPDSTSPSQELDLASKLTSHLSMQNLHFQCTTGGVKRYDTLHQVIAEFCEARLALYEKRKRMQTELLQRELAVLEREQNFVLRVCGEKGSLVKILGQSMDLVQTKLAKLGFTNMEEIQVLMKKPIRDFTLERIDSLNKQIEAKRAALAKLINTTPQEIWLEELSKLEQELKRDAAF